MVRGSAPRNVVSNAMFDEHAKRPALEQVVFQVRSDPKNMEQVRAGVELAVAQATAQMRADKGEEASEGALWLRNRLDDRFISVHFLFKKPLADAWRARTSAGKVDLAGLGIAGVGVVGVSFPERADPKEFRMLGVPNQIDGPGLLAILTELGHKVSAVEPVPRAGLDMAQAGAFIVTVEPGAPFIKMLEFLGRDGQPGRTCPVHPKSSLEPTAPGTWAAIVARRATQSPIGSQKRGRAATTTGKTVLARWQDDKLTIVPPAVPAEVPMSGAPEESPALQRLAEEAPAAGPPNVSLDLGSDDAATAPDAPARAEQAPDVQQTLAAATATYKEASDRSMDLRLAKADAELAAAAALQHARTCGRTALTLPQPVSQELAARARATVDAAKATAEETKEAFLQAGEKVAEADAETLAAALAVATAAEAALAAQVARAAQAFAAAEAAAAHATALQKAATTALRAKRKAKRNAVKAAASRHATDLAQRAVVDAQEKEKAAAAARLAVAAAQREALEASAAIPSLDGSHGTREGHDSSDEEQLVSDEDPLEGVTIVEDDSTMPASDGAGVDAFCGSDEEVVAVAKAGKRCKAIVPIMRDTDDEWGPAGEAEVGLEGSEEGGAGGAATQQND